MAMMKELVNTFINARTEFIELLNTFPADRVDERCFGKWNLREVLAHFTAWDRYFTQAVKLLKQGVAMPYWERIDSFNANAVKRTGRLDWNRLQSDFIKAGAAFIETYQKLPDELEHKLIWKKRGYTPTRFVEINIEHYTNDQVKSITRLVKKLKK